MRFLDFGCGTGTFTARFLERAAWPKDKLEISLVEPVEDQRRRAAADLARFTDRPITHWSSLPGDRVGCFDLVVTNFVVPYVRDLMGTLRQLLAGLAPGGLLLAANAGKANALTDMIEMAFESIGKPNPYHLTERMEAALRELGVCYELEAVPHGVSFPDSEENRMKLIRFLLTDYFAQVPHEPLLRFFDAFAKEGRIEMQTQCEHFVIRAGGGG